MVKKFFQKQHIPWIVVSVLLSMCSVLYTINISKISNFTEFKNVRFEKIALYDEKGKFHDMYYYSDKKAIVLIVQGNGCPIVRKSIPYINRLNKEFEAKGVKTFMVNVSPQDSRKSVEKEVEDYGITVPVLKDDLQYLVKALGIQRTMETFVINPDGWKIIYHGALSDQWDYESTKPAAQFEYVKKVLEGHLEGKEIHFRKTKVNGCLISVDVEKKN